MKKRWEFVLLGIFGGLLAAGLLQLEISPPGGEPVQLLPPPTKPALVVHVSGAVKLPGVYTFATGSRIGDAIEVAGSFSADADAQRLNLAAFLSDGMLITVPQIATPQPTNLDGSLPTTAAATPSYPININTASLEELDYLPGICPVSAQAIINYREQNGPFENIQEIMNAPGIGLGTFVQIEELITVDAVP